MRSFGNMLMAPVACDGRTGRGRLMTFPRMTTDFQKSNSCQQCMSKNSKGLAKTVSNRNKFRTIQNYLPWYSDIKNDS